MPPVRPLQGNCISHEEGDPRNSSRKEGACSWVQRLVSGLTETHSVVGGVSEMVPTLVPEQESKNFNHINGNDSRENVGASTCRQGLSGNGVDWDGKKDERKKHSGNDVMHDVCMTGYLSNEEGNTSGMNLAFYFAAAGTLVIWQILVVLIYSWTPRIHFRLLTETELRVGRLSGSVLLVSLLSKLIPFIVPSRKSRKRLEFSGVMVGACVVQFIAVASSFLMSTFPVPILTDPVTKVEVYMPLLGEWTALAFLMTFLAEGVDPGDSDPEKSLLSKLGTQTASAFAQSVSTFCGLLLPLCPNTFWWCCCMLVSCLLYVCIFPRVYIKWHNFRNTPRGQSADQLEKYDRSRLAYQLIASCTLFWTAFVIAYFVEWLLPPMLPESSKLRAREFGFVLSMCEEVLCKVIFLHLIVEVHHSVFDGSSRAARRLEDLRRLLSVVWECSSDAIAISVRGLDGKVTTMLSPTFLKICRIDKMDIPTGLTGVVFEQELSDSAGAATANSTGTRAESSSDYCCVDVADGKKIYLHDPTFHHATRKGLLSMRRLMGKAWEDKQHESFIHYDLSLQNGSSVQCEAKVTRLEPNALVAVVRDVSSRHMLFEAEKKALYQKIAREKDEQANRFTRHEVKNGLLAAMALCDTIKDTVMPESHAPESEQDSAGPEARRASLECLRDSNQIRLDQNGDHLFRLGLSAAITELDSTLKEVLDTILSEAMARDVIHEVYEPKMERVDLQNVLCSPRSYGNTALSRFPLVTHPSPLPIVIFDPQLLRYIHRNAISNACKYGQKGGMVLTDVTYYAEEGQLEMNVINLPGEQHKMLLDGGHEVEEAVFARRRRLHAHHDEGNGLHSQGDGAWISRKCAKTFGGDCSIRFEEERTVFTVRCPAQVFKLSKHRQSMGPKDHLQFKLPDTICGIAIDDSKIQRKLMHRLFAMVGIPADRQTVLGQNGEEIHGFNELVKKKLKEYPDSKFLLIVDENLEVTDDITKSMTVSGSKSVEKLRQEIDPCEEERFLALIRSANDSAVDIATYKSRAHGFFPKAPVKKDEVLDLLGSLWAKRYPNSHVDADYEGDSDVDLDMFVSSAADLMQTVEVIDALCLQKAVLPARWPVLWEKLHSLKGDLQTIQQSKLVSDVLGSINQMRGDELPEDFLSIWKVIRGVIITIIRC